MLFYKGEKETIKTCSRSHRKFMRQPGSECLALTVPVIDVLLFLPGTNESMKGWTDGKMNRWSHGRGDGGWKGRWMNGQMGGRMDGWVEGWIDECMTDRQMDENMERWISRRKKPQLFLNVSIMILFPSLYFFRNNYILLQCLASVTRLQKFILKWIRMQSKK